MFGSSIIGRLLSSFAVVAFGVNDRTAPDRLRRRIGCASAPSPDVVFVVIGREAVHCLGLGQGSNADIVQAIAPVVYFFTQLAPHMGSKDRAQSRDGRPIMESYIGPNQATLPCPKS